MENPIEAKDLLEADTSITSHDEERKNV